MGSRRGRDELIAWREQIRAEIRFLERFIPALIQRGNKQEADRKTGELEDLRRQLETSEPPLSGFPATKYWTGTRRMASLYSAALPVNVTHAVYRMTC